MHAFAHLVLGVALLAGFASLAAAGSLEAGKAIFASHCQTCHGGTGPADSPIAVLESGAVWDRQSLRRFLAAPQKEIPGTLMPVQVTDPKQLDELLDYLESLH